MKGEHMKTQNLKLRSLAFLLAVITLMSCVVALPTAAIDIEEEPLPDFLWELDFDKMSSITDNMGSSDYTIEGKNVKLLDAHGKKALGVVDGSCHYIINDVNNLLNKYDTFSIEADMFFESYPSGEAGGKNSHEYPMSFMTWITAGTSGNPTYRSLRVDGEGYLCTGSDPINKPEQKSSAKLPLGEWFTIRFLVSPLTGFCEVYINGQNLLSYKIGKPTTLAKSQVRFFDARYAYTAYFSNISVYTDSSYRIGLVEEEATDYVAYQTSKIENGKFDLRVISGTNIQNVTEYNRAGFVVTTLKTEGDEVVVNEQDVNITTVYESLVADGKTVTAAELGSKYVVPIPVDGLDADALHLEVVVRPYIKKDGMRYFGDAAILIYSGDVKDGYPVFNMAGSSVEYTAFPSDDTFVKLNNSENFGEKNLFELKNNGQNNAYTREIYIKFKFSENALKRLLSSSRIYLEFYVNSHRTLTADEEAEGGILADICGVDTNWTETELTGINYKQLAKEIEYIGDVRYQSKKYTQVDVTEYVLSNARGGEVAFKISNVENDGASGQMSVASSEASSGSPRLVIYPIMYNHEINLGKLKNNGYEPWGYAEKLVNEWFKTDYDQLYAHAPYENKIDNWKVENSAPTGDYTVKIDWKASTPTGKWNSKVYARTLDTLTGYKAGALSEYDEYGGITNSGIKGNATGYFHTETIGNRTYIIDPIGNPFFAAGINTVKLGDTTNQQNAAIEKYGSAENFYKGVAQELRDMGINTYWGGDSALMNENKLARAIGLGCISGYMSTYSLGVSTGGSAEFLHNNTMNVFDPDFASYCNTKIASTVELYKDNPYVLGFYSDNEIPSENDMLYRYLTIDPTEPVNAFSYATAWTWLIKHTGNPNASINDITEKMSEEFKAFVYNRYFKSINEALEAAGAGEYMYLGNRIHSENKSSEGYLRAASKYVDVLTVNLYGGMNIQSIINNIETMYKYVGKPFIVTEFFAKADDAVDMNGYTLGNQTNAGMIVKTQQDRANYYENYVMLLLESQTCVGWTWYRFRDNDQTIYQDEGGNLYRAFDYKDGAISAYTNVKTGSVVENGPAFAPSLTVFYRGEGDTSNLGSNKGFYDNKMNVYEELTGSVKNVTDNIFGLINYFDELNK